MFFKNNLLKCTVILGELYEREADITIIQLRNPCTGISSRYICQHEHNKFYELLKYNETNRSWFINDILALDNAIYMTTIIDPLFLVLPYIQEHCATVFAPLDNILKDDKYPEICEFSSSIELSQLLMVRPQI